MRTYPSSSLICVTPMVDGLSSPIVVATADGFARTGVRRRIVTVMVASWACAARATGAASEQRTRAEIEKKRRDIGGTRESGSGGAGGREFGAGRHAISISRRGQVPA